MQERPCRDKVDNEKQFSPEIKNSLLKKQVHSLELSKRVWVEWCRIDFLGGGCCCRFHFYSFILCLQGYFIIQTKITSINMTATHTPVPLNTRYIAHHRFNFSTTWVVARAYPTAASYCEIASTCYSFWDISQILLSGISSHAQSEFKVHLVYPIHLHCNLFLFSLVELLVVPRVRRNKPCGAAKCKSNG